MKTVPYSDKIDWEFPRPWGGGSADSRSIRLYYGSLATAIPACRPLSREDIAWCLLDDGEDPADYDWDFAVGHELWLWPVGFKTSPQTRKLVEFFKDKHLHRIVTVSGWDADTLKLIEKGKTPIADAGRARVVHRHKFLQEGA